ncbi:winged helix-turn-helix transcriptional regulator [Microbacteriaceae bacterium VKM Ac-2855]|nr:winged helix-turn-helix transcriptional regulator [Microbacteriaceae bacterium VKM Ac-2855]
MNEDQLNQVFSALADPTRRAILDRLTEGDASVGDLGEPFAISQPAVSKHLKILERAGLISRSRSATVRLSHLEATPLREASEYVQRYRRFWEAGFDRLDERLAAYTAEQDAVTRAAASDGPDPSREDPA